MILLDLLWFDFIEFNWLFVCWFYWYYCCTCICTFTDFIEFICVHFVQVQVWWADIGCVKCDLKKSVAYWDVEKIWDNDFVWKSFMSSTSTIFVQVQVFNIHGHLINYQYHQHTSTGALTNVFCKDSISKLDPTVYLYCNCTTCTCT